MSQLTTKLTILQKEADILLDEFSAINNNLADMSLNQIDHRLFSLYDRLEALLSSFASPLTEAIELSTSQPEQKG